MSNWQRFGIVEGFTEPNGQGFDRREDIAEAKRRPFASLEGSRMATWQVFRRPEGIGGTKTRLYASREDSAPATGWGFTSHVSTETPISREPGSWTAPLFCVVATEVML